jgi:hypothetical protein
MNTLSLECDCGAVKMDLIGPPLMQYVCHCDDCQATHGAAYACALYPANSVIITGEISASTLKSSPRTKCARCETYLFAEVPGQPFRGVNGALFPNGVFVPAFHMQCRFAQHPIGDELPHYKSLAPQFGGSDERMQW